MVFILLVVCSVCLAEKKTFVRDYTYKAGESDSKISARDRALKEIKVLLMEEIGMYIESYVNYRSSDSIGISKSFFDQEIKTLSGGTTETKIIEEKWNGYEYYVKAEIIADPDEIVRKINESLLARRSSVVVDSLRMLLSSSSKEIELKDEELVGVKSRLEEQNRIVTSRAKELEELKQQLAGARFRLEEYDAQEKLMQTEVEKIETKIHDERTLLLKNARRYMTREELVRVCGKPRGDEDIYGDLIVNFKNGVLIHIVALIDRRIFVYTSDWDRANLLKK